MNKEIKSININSLLELILIHVVYCVCKLLITDCGSLDLFIYIAVVISLIVSLIINFHNFKKKELLFFIAEPLLLILLISVYVCFNAPGIDYFAYKCDGGFFSGMNYVAFIFYFVFGRIIIWIIGIISKIVSNINNKNQSK